MNRNYLRSRAKEQLVKNQLEKDGYYAIRSAGSKGIADIIGIKPTNCGHPHHLSAKFIQVKVSEKIKEWSINLKVVDSPCGLINVEFWKFPVKSKKWYANKKKLKQKSLKKLQSSKHPKRLARFKPKSRILPKSTKR